MTGVGASVEPYHDVKGWAEQVHQLPLALIPPTETEYAGVLQAWTHGDGFSLGYTGLAG